MSKLRLQGIIFGIAGILLFSSKAVMVKLAYRYGVDTVSLLLLRMVFSLPFYIVIALIGRPAKAETIRGRDYLWLVGLGFIGYYLASYFDFLGLQYIKAGLERLILFVYPTLVILISYLAFGTTITPRQRWGVAITYFGVAVIFSRELIISGEDDVLLGGILIFLSALTYAGYLVGSGWLIPKFGVKMFTSYAMMISCCCVVIHYILTREVSIFDFPPEVYWLALAMAVSATVIPSFLISMSIQRLGANEFSILGSLGPVSTIGLAAIFLGERLTWLQLLGALVVIGGIFLAEKKKSS